MKRRKGKLRLKKQRKRNRMETKESGEEPEGKVETTERTGRGGSEKQRTGEEEAEAEVTEKGWRENRDEYRRKCEVKMVKERGRIDKNMVEKKEEAGR